MGTDPNRIVLIRIAIKGFRVVCGFEHEMIILVMHVSYYDCTRYRRILFNETFSLSNKIMVPCDSNQQQYCQILYTE